MKTRPYKLALISAIALTAGSFTQLLHAQVISVDFYDGNTPLTSSDSTGAVAATNWQNVDVSSSKPSGLILDDNSATPTSATLTVNPSGGAQNGKGTTYSTGNNGSYVVPTSPAPTTEQILYTGYIATSNGNGFTTELSLNNIPYANYAVYVYTLSDNYSSGEEQIYSPTVGSPGSYTAGASYFFDTGAQFYAGNDLPTTFVQATGTTAGTSTSGANYVEFSGLTGGSQLIDINADAVAGHSTNKVITISGIQIVDLDAATPEPSTWALMLGGMGVLVWFSRRQKLGNS